MGLFKNKKVSPTPITISWVCCQCKNAGLGLDFFCHNGWASTQVITEYDLCTVKCCIPIKRERVHIEGMPAEPCKANKWKPTHRNLDTPCDHSVYYCLNCKVEIVRKGGKVETV